MEYAGFLNLPHQNCNFKNIISWNINGAKTKLEKINVYNFLSDYDIIALNEVKTPINICIPGYVYYSSKSVRGAASRGVEVVQ